MTGIACEFFNKIIPFSVFEFGNTNLYNGAMAKIDVLPEEISSKIAAGEVIDSPSSVVRELIDNSIDAESTKITVNVIEGGKKLIEVVDDGIGMDKEDIEKSYIRHATSKIKSIDDLYKITTMGFRGEALTSIAEVSELEIISRTENQVEGHKITVKGGKLIESAPTSSIKGTIVRVKDLFFNMPARRNFLKSDLTEYKSIFDIFIKKAIVFPEITFELIKDLKTDIILPKVNTLHDRIISIYPELRSLNHKVHEDPNMKIEIFFSKPTISRPTRSLQQVFVNRRFVEAKGLLGAFSKAYANYLPRGSYPIVFCFITIDPSLIDVNIHPAKKEVKFRNEGKIFHYIVELISNGLKETDQVIEINESELMLNPIEKNIKRSIETFLQNQNKLKFTETPPPYDKTEETKFDEPKNYKFTYGIDEIPTSIHPSTEETFEINKQTQEYQSEHISQIREEKAKEFEIRFVGSIFSTYLIFEIAKENKIMVIDQHALHERIIYSQKYKELTTKGNLEKQNLLIPHRFKISKDYRDTLEENIKIFEKLGFSMNINDDSVEVLSIPLFFSTEIDIENTLMELCEKIKEDESINIENILEKLASVSCKSAIKGGTQLTSLEAYKLLEDALSIDDRYTCPHGRPTMIYIEKSTLESMFMRR